MLESAVLTSAWWKAQITGGVMDALSVGNLESFSLDLP